jgi:hypothetical protein
MMTRYNSSVGHATVRRINERLIRVQTVSALFAASALVSAAQALSGDYPPGESLTPNICKDNVLVLVRPFFPRHVIFPESGCRVTVKFTVLPSGKIDVPHYPDDVAFEDLTQVAKLEPEECSNRYISSVLKSLRKAQFAASENGYECSYTYNWVPEE